MSTNLATSLKPLAEVSGEELEWVQPQALKRHHELRAGEQVVAVIDFERQTLATAFAAGAAWTFKREGFWHPHVTVRKAGDGTQIAVFQPHFSGGGELKLSGGDVYALKIASFWHSEWQWSHEGLVLVTTRRPSGLLKSSGIVDIPAGARAVPETELLVVLGWYLMLLYAQDMAVQVGAVAAAAR